MHPRRGRGNPQACCWVPWVPGVWAARPGPLNSRVRATLPGCQAQGITHRPSCPSGPALAEHWTQACWRGALSGTQGIRVMEEEVIKGRGREWPLVKTHFVSGMPLKLYNLRFTTTLWHITILIYSQNRGSARLSDRVRLHGEEGREGGLCESDSM